MANMSAASTPLFTSGVVRHVTLYPGFAQTGDSWTESPDVQQDNNGSASMPDLDPVRSVFTALPLSVIVFCTVFGNLLVLLAVFTTRKLRTATNYFIVNLAIADLMLGLTVLPFSTSIEILDEYWIFGQALCDMWVTVDVLCCTASIYGLCVISIDRYIGVSKPLVHHQIVNKRRAIMINLGVWMLAAAICVVPFFGWRKSLSVDISGRCEVNEDKAYVIFSATCSFFLPCTIVVLVYWRIYLKALQQTRFMKTGYKEAKMTSKTGENGVMLRIHTGALSNNTNCGHKLSVSKRDSTVSSDIRFIQAIDNNLRQRKIDWTKFKRERRAARTLGIVVGVFIACWFPFFVILPINAFCECMPKQLFKVAFWLGYVNSMMNPFIYGADSREFQMAFKRLLCGRKRPSFASQTSTPRGAVSSSLLSRANYVDGKRTSGCKGTTTTSSSWRQNQTSRLPTAQEEESEFLEVTESDAVAAPPMIATRGSNGLLTAPNANSNPHLLTNFNDQNIAVESTLVDSQGNKTVMISKASESEATSEESKSPPAASSSPTKSLLQVEKRGVATSTTSLSKPTPPSPAPMAGYDTEPEDTTPTKTQRPLLNSRMTSVSSLSTLSSPSDSDDEEVKARKQERRRKKNFDDLASLAFRRLLMIRFARRVRAKSKMRQKTNQAESNFDSMPSTTGEVFSHSLNVPKSRWMTALSKISSSPAASSSTPQSATPKIEPKRHTTKPSVITLTTEVVAIDGKSLAEKSLTTASLASSRDEDYGTSTNKLNQSTGGDSTAAESLVELPGASDRCVLELEVKEAAL